MDQSGLSLHEAEEEVLRCITVPGQSISARLGQLKINQLRLQAESTLGGSSMSDVPSMHSLSKSGVSFTILIKRGFFMFTFV